MSAKSQLAPKRICRKRFVPIILMQQSAALKATFTRRSFNPKRASMPSSPSPQESAKKEPFDIDAFLDKLFLPFDSLCRRMSVFYPYFAIQRRKYRIYTDDFKPRTSDKRGNFIPVRYPIIVDRLLQPYQNDAQELDKRADFAKIAAARFHFESLEFLNNLQESFAPFDPDSTLSTNTSTTLKKESGAGRFFSGS